MALWEGILGLICRCRSGLIPSHSSYLNKLGASLNIPVWLQRLHSVCCMSPRACCNFRKRPNLKEVRGQLEGPALGIFEGRQEGSDSAYPWWERETVSESQEQLLTLQKKNRKKRLYVVFKTLEMTLFLILWLDGWKKWRLWQGCWRRYLHFCLSLSEMWNEVIFPARWLLRGFHITGGAGVASARSPVTAWVRGKWTAVLCFDCASDHMGLPLTF